MAEDDRAAFDADAYEARVREAWMRRRARLGIFLIVAGLAGVIAIPVLLASSALGAEGLVRVLPGAFVALASGVYVLVSGLPGEPSEGPVPRRVLLRTTAWMAPITLLLAAWPLGAYRAIWHRVALAGTACESLLPIRDTEELGVRASPISRAERTSDRCLVELAPVPGSHDLASLQLVVETGTRESIGRTARRAGSRAVALPQLGPDAWRIESDGGTRILIARDGVVIRIQLARSAYSSHAVDRVIARLAAAR